MQLFYLQDNFRFYKNVNSEYTLMDANLNLVLFLLILFNQSKSGNKIQLKVS